MRAQLLLHRPCRGLEQRQHQRGDRLGAAGDVEDPERLPGVRVPHRHGAAAPRVDGFVEMLGADHLHRGGGGQGEGRGGGAHGGLGPVGPGGETHGIRAGDQLGPALDPQQAPVRIAEGDHQARLDGRVDQPGAEQGQHGGEEVRLPGGGQLLAVEGGITGAAALGRRGERAPPGGEHRRSDQAPVITQPGVGPQVLMGAQEPRLVAGVRR